MKTIARHKMVKNTVWLFFALFVAFLAVLSLVAVARSATATSVTVEPLASTVIVGDSTTVDLVIRSVSDLYGVQLQIDFDPTLVQVLDADPGEPGVQIALGTCPAPDWVLSNTADNTAGTIGYAVTSLNPSPVCNGDGLIASVEFEAVAVGESPLHFSDLLLATPDGEEIPVDVQDGTLQIEDLRPVFLPIVLRSY